MNRILPRNYCLRYAIVLSGLFMIWAVIYAKLFIQLDISMEEIVPSCRVPVPDPWDPTILEFVFEPKPVRCSPVQPQLTRLTKDHLLIFNQSSLVNGSAENNCTTKPNCGYMCFDRSSETSAKMNYSDWVLLKPPYPQVKNPLCKGLWVLKNIRYSKTSIIGTPKIPGWSCHLSNSAPYGIIFMYKRYSRDFDGSGKSVPLMESCHLWECHLWWFYCTELIGPHTCTQFISKIVVRKQGRTSALFFNCGD